MVIPLISNHDERKKSLKDLVRSSSLITITIEEVEPHKFLKPKKRFHSNPMHRHLDPSCCCRIKEVTFCIIVAAGP